MGPPFRQWHGDDAPAAADSDPALMPGRRRSLRAQRRPGQTGGPSRRRDALRPSGHRQQLMGRADPRTTAVYTRRAGRNLINTPDDTGWR